MKTYKIYTGLLAAALCWTACEPEFDNPIEDRGMQSSGTADFSNYVAVGNSLTAGLADNSLYIDGQLASFANILATQMKFAGGGEFTIPLATSNAGGLTINGMTPIDSCTNRPRFPIRTVLGLPDGATSPAPVPYAQGGAPSEVLQGPKGPFNNMGVPGATVGQLLFEGLGNPAGLAAVPPTANPYFIRMASSPDASILGDAVSQNPTFFSLWIGNNDLLGYAAGGGTVKTVENPCLGDPLTPTDLFAGAYQRVANILSKEGTVKGVLINIPDITSIPFFTTVPNNALVLDAEQAAQLTQIFGAIARIARGSLLAGGASEEQATQVASQYAITFNAGPNRWIIDVPASPATNPFGFRQMTEDELVLLTIDQTRLRTEMYGSFAATPQILQVLGKLGAGGQPTPEEVGILVSGVNGLDDKDVLDATELEEIKTAQTSYNETIQGVADQLDLALYDAQRDLARAADTGVPIDGAILTTEFATGGVFSLDGVHLTPRGNAFVANGVIRAINAKYGAQLTEVSPGTFTSVTVR